MVCSMVKKGVVGAALGAGALFLVFGTHAPELRPDGLPQGPAQRQGRGPAASSRSTGRGKRSPASSRRSSDNIEKLARAEVDVEHLDREIAAIRTNLDAEKKALLTLRESLKTGDFRLAGHAGGLHRGRGQGRPGPPATTTTTTSRRSSRRRKRPSRPSRARSSPPASSSRP